MLTLRAEEDRGKMRNRSLGLKLVLLIGLTFSAFGPVSAQEEFAGGILYGANWGCAVTAPSGWFMDQESWAKNNIYALFYEKGKKLGPTIPIVYVRTSQLNAATDAEMTKYIDWDVSNVRKGAGNTAVERDLKLSNGSKLRAFDYNYGNAQFETVAYQRYKDTCFLVILASRDKAKFEANIPKLKEVLLSMEFMDKP